MTFVEAAVAVAAARGVGSQSSKPVATMMAPTSTSTISSFWSKSMASGPQAAMQGCLHFLPVSVRHLFGSIVALSGTAWGKGM